MSRSIVRPDVYSNLMLAARTTLPHFAVSSEHGASQSREARLDVGIGQRRSDLLVEPLDDIEPTPDDAIVILPGLALAKSINSGTLLAATDGSTSRT